MRCSSSALRDLRCAACLPLTRLWSAIILLSALGGCRATEFFIANAPDAFAHIERRTDLAYGSEVRQRLDVYLPHTQAPRPVVIFWYGGSWSQGSKGEYRFVGETLARAGFVAFLPDYRLYPQVTFPLFDEDGARAVAWVERHAAEFGGDARHIVLMGHSAGAHTAALLAFDHDLLRRFGGEPACIAGLVGLSGPYELVPDSAGLRATFAPPYTPRDWQPIQFVDAAAPPALLLHGEDDKDVRPAQTLDLQQALQAIGVRVEVHLYPHRGHGATIAPFALVTRWRAPAVRDTVGFVNSVTAFRSHPGAGGDCLAEGPSGR
jgi:acetyl esterase/lipase